MLVSNKIDEMDKKMSAGIKQKCFVALHVIAAVIALFYLLLIAGFAHAELTCSANETAQSFTFDTTTNTWPSGTSEKTFTVGTGSNQVDLTFTATELVTPVSGDPSLQTLGNRTTLRTSSNGGRANGTSLATLKLSTDRPINKLSFIVNDVDYSNGNNQNFRDRLIFTGNQGVSTAITAVNNGNFNIDNSTGTVTSNDQTCDTNESRCSINVDYNRSGITDATGTFRAAHGNGSSTQQFIGYSNFSWCLPPSVDLAIDKTGTSSVTQAGTVSYTIKIWNKGPNTVASSTFTDTVPTNLTGVTWSCAASGSASCGTTTSGSGNNISVTTGSLPVNTSDTAPTGTSSYLTYTVSGTATTSGNITNTASIATPSGITDPITNNNSDQANTTINTAASVSPDPAIKEARFEISPSLPTIYRGTSGNQTISITNRGPDAATNTVATVIPAPQTGVTVNSVSVVGGNICTFASSQWSCSIGGVANNGNFVLNVNYSTTASSSLGTAQQVTVKVKSNEFNPGSGVGESLYKVWGTNQQNESRTNGAFWVGYTGTGGSTQVGTYTDEGSELTSAWPLSQSSPTGAYLVSGAAGLRNSIYGASSSNASPMIQRVVTNMSTDSDRSVVLSLNTNADNRRAWEYRTGIYIPAAQNLTFCTGNTSVGIDDGGYIVVDTTNGAQVNTYIPSGDKPGQNITASFSLGVGYHVITYRIVNRNTYTGNAETAAGGYGPLGILYNGSCNTAGFDVATNIGVPASINIVDGAKVKVAKISNGGVGQFDYTGMTNLMNSNSTAITTDTVTTTTAGNAATSAQQNYATALNTAVTITEAAAANYNLASARCTDANSGATGNTGTFGSLAGNVLTIPAANIKAAADITCTFTNNKQRNLTLKKSWVNAKQNDAATVTATGLTSLNAVADTPTETDVAAPQSANVGNTITLGETITTGTGNYNAVLSCINDSDSSVIAVNASNQIVMPDSDISCTFTNTKRPTLQLAKAWGANSSPSDSASIGATTGGANNTTAFSTSGGTAANSGTAVNIAVGNTITFPAETGTNIANYNTVLSCLAGGGATANSLSGTNGQVSNTLLIGTGDAGKAIVCTYTNTRKSTTFRLAKVWGANSTAGNVANIGATTGLINNTAAFTSTASTTTNGTAVTVYAGETATLPQETMSTGTLANYNTTLSCDAGTLSGTNGQNTGNTLTIPAAATSTNPITCTYTNTPKTATLQLSKTWGANSPATDSATIGATTGGSANTAAFTTTGGTNANSGVVTVTVGNTITFPAETGTNIANYSSGFSCLAGGGATANSVNGNNGQASSTLLIGAGDAGKAIVCTYNNTRKTTNVTLRKVWSGAASNDSAIVNLKRGATTVDSLTSTSTGNNTDNDTTPFAAFVGETLNLSEVLGGSNAGQYTASLACDNGVTVAGNGDFTVPSTATNCTVTNTRKTRTVTLTKALSPTTDAGKFNLLVNGTAVATNIGHGGSGNVVVPVGSSVSISETAGTSTTLTNYSTGFSCNTNPSTTGNTTSGSFTQPDADVACTFTNTRKSASLTIVKQWQNGKSGDAISIPATTGLSNNTTVLTSTASAAGNNANTGTSVIAYVGETANFGTETFTTGSAANYNATLACSGAADTNLTDGLTISAADTAITCTYTNSRIAQQLNVAKQWQNAVNGHTATVATTGGTNNPTFNSTATGNNSTSGTAVTVYAGDVVTLPAETFGGGASAAQYNSALACSGGTTLANGAVNRSITISNSTTATTCTYSNARKSATLTLSKTWSANSIAGDTVTVTSSGFGNNATSGTSTATAAGNTMTGTSVTVYAGETGTVTEAFTTGNANNYTSALSCTGNSTALTGNSLTISNTDTAINCSYTNTRISNAVKLTKAWTNGKAGDKVDLTITGGSSAVTGSSTAGGTTTNATATGLAGNTISFAESFSVGNSGNYSTSLNCTKDSNGNAVTVTGSSITMPADSAVTCTYTNSRKIAGLTLRKTWANAKLNDAVNVTATGLTPLASVADTASETDAATAQTVYAGDSITLGETFTAGTAANYNSSLACSGNGTALSSNVLTVNSADTAITCTYTNSRIAQQVSVAKTWQNALNNHTASATTTGGTNNATVSSTSTGNNTTTGTAVTMYAGDVVTLPNETLGGGASAAQYNSTLACSGGTPLSSGAVNRSITISNSTTATVCTYTNARKSATLTLRKTWSNAKVNDAVNVTATGLTSLASVADTASETDTGTAQTVYVGDSITLSEAFTTGTASNYNSGLACTGTSGLSGSTLTVGNTDTAITCTYTNTRKSASLVLRKTWSANSITGDTVTVTSSGFGNNATSGTSTATAAGNTTTGTSVTVYAGETGSITEAFGTGNAANYNATLACSGNSNAISGNSLTIGNNDTAINCAYTNTVKQADLVIDKVAPATVTQGSSLSYTIKVWNKGPSAVSNSTVTDTVPASLTGVTWTCDASGSASCGAASGSGNSISVTTGSLPVNSSNTAPTSGSYLTFNVTATASSVGSVTNTATVGNPVGAVESNNGNNSSSATTNVIASTVVISGRVFEDNSGTTNVVANAYNGTQQAGEIGLGKVSVRLTNCASTTLATTQTDANGDYSFSIGAGSLSAPNFCLVETNLADYTSVSGSGTYDRATDIITLSNTGATSYSNNNFGDAKLALVLSEQGQQTVIAGGVVDYPHRIVSSSVLDLTALNKTASQQPANANDQAWESLLYRDTNCNGKVDAGEALLVNSLPLTFMPAQQVCVVQRVRVPVNASSEAQYVSQLQASYKATLADRSVLNRTSNIVTDTTLTGSAGLDLQKRVRVVASCPSTAADTNPFVTSNQASNGNFLEYEIIYRNNSVKNLIDVSLKDSVPTGTVFQNVSCNVNPVSCTATHNSGTLTWQMTGSLLPNKQGTVRFCVAVP